MNGVDWVGPLKQEGELLALVFGASGLLGYALGPALRMRGVRVTAPRSAEVDITDFGAVAATIDEDRPHLVINLAAESGVDRCEVDPDRAFRVNALGPHNLALACAAADIPLLHVSTDYVFDGRQTRPYRESDPTGTPPNTYGQAKLLGEVLVRRHARRHYIVRVAALYGAGRQDVVDWLIEGADPKAPLPLIVDCALSPTWTVEVAEQIVAILETPYYGTYHATGDGTCSWYDVARVVLENQGGDPDGIRGVKGADLGRPARRPTYSVLENHHLRLRGIDRMGPWRPALERYLATRKG